MKLNDWVIANLNNPDFDVLDFLYVAEMNLENTQLLPESYYVNNQYITERPEFKDDNGQFSKDKFSDFYNSVTSSFLEFSSEDQINNFEYSMFDIRRTKDDKVQDINFLLGVRPNPEHNKIGIEGFNKITASDESVREIAQNNNIYDYEKGLFLDYSVNDISLFSNPAEYFKSLFGEPLVYATYDEDVEEIDPFTGNKVLHKKGTFKLNDKGEYYVETLGDRPLHGKLVVSGADYLTSEYSSFNKYDFFDSDDVLKSIGGSIAKTVVSLLPMFIPGVNKVYSTLFVLRETAKSMPMLYGIATGLAGMEDTSSKILNNIASYGHKFTTSTSDYAQLNIFAFENFANLASEVVLQFGQLQQIINAFLKLSGGSLRAMNTAYAKALKLYENQVKKALKDVGENKLAADIAVKGIGTSNIGNITEELIKTGKWMDTPFGQASVKMFVPKAQKIVLTRTKIGLDLALGYMAVVSNTDVYETVLEKGGTPLEAAAITLGSIIGMYSVDKFLGLGELFFKNEPARIALREVARKEASSLKTIMGVSKNSSDTQTKKGIMGLVQKGINSGRNIIKNYRYNIKDKSLGFVGKAIGEGLEEVSEELVTDLSKATAEVLGKLGYFSLEDYGAGENAFERYAMSFLGGTMGGAIFGARELYMNRHQNTQDLLNDILYLLREGKKEDILKEIEILRKRGELGSKTLSFNVSEDGKSFLTAESEQDSLSQKVYDTLVKTINQLDMILNENQLNLSDDLLFDKMVQGEYRSQALTDFLKGDNESVKNFSYISRYYEDYQKLINKIADKEAEILLFKSKYKDTEENKEDFKTGLELLLKLKEELLKERDFLFGEGSLGYVLKTLFAMDPNLIGNFAPINLNQFVRMQTGKSLSELTPEESKHYKKNYEEYSKQIKFTLDEAFRAFLNIQEQVNPDITLVQGSSELAKSIREALKLYPYERLANWDTKLDDETDEEYNNRNESLEEKTDEEKQIILDRRKLRLEKLEKQNRNNIEKFISEFSKSVIDRSTFRQFVALSKLLSKDLVSNIIKQFRIQSNLNEDNISEETEFLSKILDNDFNDKLLEILSTVNIEDEETILDKVHKLISDKAYDVIKELIGSNFDHPQWQLLEGFITKSDIVELMLKIILNRRFGINRVYESLLSLLKGEDLESHELDKDITDIWLSDLSKKAKSEGITKEVIDEFLRIWNHIGENEFSKETYELFKKISQEFQDNVEYIGLKRAVNLLSLSLFEDKDFGISELIEYFKEEYDWDFEGDSDISAKNREIIDYLTRVMSGISSLEDEEGLETVNFSSDFVEKEASNFRDSIFGQIQTLLYDKLFNVIKNDPLVNSLKNIEKSGFNINNPIVQLLSKISSIFKSENSIEDILNQIYTQFENSENYNQFELTQLQIDLLLDVLQSLDILRAVVIAASTNPSQDSPIGHNLQINNFVKNHPEIFKNFKELLTLDQNDSNFILSQIDLYKREIMTWINLSLNNSANKVLKFVQSDQALINTRLDFYKIHRDAFKISDNVDLLEGYELLEIGETLLDIVKIEELIHLNYIKAINSGMNNKTILETVLPKITNLEKVFLQKTSKLDENLEYNNLTDYDKFLIFVSALSVDNLNFYTNLEKYINDNERLAPLAILEFAARIIEAQRSNPELINLALDFVSLQVPEGKVIPWLPNTSFLSGVGGSGKTDAVIRIIVSDGSNVNLSGPTLNLIDNLSVKFKEGTSITLDKLFELALGPNYTDILKYTTITKDGEEKFFNNGKIYKKIVLPNGESNIILTSKFKVQKIENPPKEIIIDEATHLSSLELLIIAKFCQENGINLILAGDEYLNGFKHVGFTYNIENFRLLTWRCPKLFISLRDNNLQKIINLRSCINILSAIDDTDSKESSMVVAKNLFNNELKNLLLSYHLESEFTGELITDELNPEILNKIKKGSVIGFVGEESSSYVKQLRDAGFIVEIHSPKTIQGSEYDYVVVDLDWKLDVLEDDPNLDGKIFRFMLNLYTMISRSKEGTILIDNGLSDIVKNVKATASGKPSPIKNAISTFKKIRLLQIQEIKDYFNSFPKSTNEDDGDSEDNDSDGIDNSDGVDDYNPNDGFEGTEVSKKDVEKDFSEDLDDLNELSRESQNDAQDSENKELKPSYGNNKPNSPIRVYGNMSLSGLDYSQEELTNESDSRKDLGIFIRKGSKVNKKEIDKYVKLLMELKSILSFGTDYLKRASSDFRELFSKESFKNIEYFINVEDDNNTTNHLIGLTTLKKDKKSISNGKIITLVAKLKDKNGNDCYITLGGLANPETWNNEKENIKSSIENRILDLEETIKTAPEKDKENLSKEISDLKEYLLNLDDYIKSYKRYIKEISEKDQMIPINPPESTGMTDLISSDHYLRLEDINSSYSEFGEHTKYAVVSEPFIITEDIKGLSPKIKGKTIVYASSNIFLKPSELESIYLNQKESPYTHKPMVRMIVLNNEGVSFKSLRLGKYKHIYTTSIGKVKRVNPFTSHKVAIEMYISMWNFRANLKTFLRTYEKWISENNLTNEEVEEYCRLDNEYYNNKRKELKDDKLDEKIYRESILKDSNISNEIKELLKLIWNFNDSLSSKVKLFRLGYNSKHGAYIRKLTNLKEGELYKYPDKVNGIYINPTLALQYESALDYLFSNVIDKIIPPILTSEFDKTKLPYINLSINKFEKWYKEIKEQGKPIYLNLIEHTDLVQDVKKLESFPVELPAADVLSQLPTVLVLISKYLESRSFNIQSFDEYRAKKSKDGSPDKFDIKIGEESINYVGITQSFNGLFETLDIDSTITDPKIPGVTIWEYTEHGVDHVKLIDLRLDNLFSLMFHGMISTSRENDFERGDIRATDAVFKFGFKSDHIMLAKVDGKDRTSVPIATNKKLLSSNVIPGFPIFNISLDTPKNKQKPKLPKENKQETDNSLKNFKSTVRLTVNEAVGYELISLKTLSRYNTKESILKKVNKDLENKLITLFKKSLSTIVNEDLNQSLQNLKKIVTGINEDGHIIYLNLEIGESEIIESIEYDTSSNKIIVITNEKIHTYYINENGGSEIIHDSKVKPLIENTSEENVNLSDNKSLKISLSYLKERIQEILASHIQEDLDDIIDIILSGTELDSKNDLNKNITSEDIKIIINSINNNIGEELSDSLNHEVIELIVMSLDLLTSKYCKLPN